MYFMYACIILIQPFQLQYLNKPIVSYLLPLYTFFHQTIVFSHHMLILTYLVSVLCNRCFFSFTSYSNYLMQRQLTWQCTTKTVKILWQPWRWHLHVHSQVFPGTPLRGLKLQHSAAVSEKHTTYVQYILTHRLSTALWLNIILPMEPSK